VCTTLLVSVSGLQSINKGSTCIIHYGAIPSMLCLVTAPCCRTLLTTCSRPASACCVKTRTLQHIFSYQLAYLAASQDILQCILPTILMLAPRIFIVGKISKSSPWSSHVNEFHYCGNPRGIPFPWDSCSSKLHPGGIYITSVPILRKPIVWRTTKIGHYTGQPVLASTSSQELEDFVGAKFLLPTCPCWWQLAHSD